MKMCVGISASLSAEGLKKKIELPINSIIQTPSPVNSNVNPSAQTTGVSNETGVKEPVADLSKNGETTTAPKVSASIPQNPVRPASPVYKKSISINEKLNGNKDKNLSVDLEETAVEIATQFDQNLLENKWSKYIYKLETLGRMSLVAAMKKRKPIITNEIELTFTVDTAAAEKDLNQEKLELLGFLRKELSNTKITLTIAIGINDSSADVPYTPSEKFKKLAEINPAMNELKSQFDLEIEY